MIATAAEFTDLGDMFSLKELSSLNSRKIGHDYSEANFNFACATKH
jgi:hypothetical protein